MPRAILHVGDALAWLELERLVAVFREVRRVLRPDGTLWLNLGDAFVSEGPGSGPGSMNGSTLQGSRRNMSATRAAKTLTRSHGGGGRRDEGFNAGLKRKDAIFIPHRVAMALQQDGWWCRGETVWSKASPMPESVRDRPTRAHEYVFLLAKSPKYFYDAVAISEPAETGDHARNPSSNGEQQAPGQKRQAGFSKLRTQGHAGTPDGLRRNRRSVWHLASEPFPEAHFATFPTALVEPCVLGGSSEKGCCPSCGAPVARVVDYQYISERPEHAVRAKRPGRDETPRGKESAGPGANLVTTTGWKPSCRVPKSCDGLALATMGPRPCRVLDPFAGAGTTGLVAMRYQRDFTGIELNPEYAEMAAKRIRSEAPLVNKVGIVTSSGRAGHPLEVS